MNKVELKSKYLADVRAIVPDMSSTEADNLLWSGELGVAISDNIDSKVLKGIAAKYRKLLNGEVLNHEAYKLSALDLEMMKNVKPGGNYRDIPLEIAKKSKRLGKLMETGGRTTYYGRLAWDKPSYTITTYWHRPGSGTHMLPESERVLSVREAARLQGFEDTYYFYGSKTQLLKQVGNAVPPIVAYQIGKKIVEKFGAVKSIDLFSGAGGLTRGMKLSGIDSVMCNDIVEQALISLKINMPETNVLCGDITQRDVKNTLIKAGLGNDVQVVAGGPPCQGYSLAGKRDSNDSRNRLFEDFVEVVDGIRPKVFVFENVEGILTYNLGETYREIQAAFKSKGYKLTGRKLLFSDYGVPQRRKRVILIGVREDLGVEPDELYPQELTVGNEVTVRESLGDICNIECKDGALYAGKPESLISKYYRGDISIADYVEDVVGR